VGVRDILMDYLHATSVRLAAESAVALALLFYLIWSASILWAR
jgi:succinate dehydrogenase / fumarate reductase membrane anchor subunit